MFILINQLSFKINYVILPCKFSEEDTKGKKSFSRYIVIKFQDISLYVYTNIYNCTNIITQIYLHTNIINIYELQSIMSPYRTPMDLFYLGF